MSQMLKKLLVAAIAAAALAACSSTKAPEVKPVASAPVEAPAPEASAPAAPVVMNNNATFFAFNKYDIKDDYKGIIGANANYLAATKDAKVQVQGNTDDIGSVEYNLALGQKRANAVKKALIASGVSKKQIETVSNGKLKPKFANDNDADRAKNRRADIVYKNEEPHGYSVDQNGLPVVDEAFYNGTITEGVLN